MVPLEEKCGLVADVLLPLLRFSSFHCFKSNTFRSPQGKSAFFFQGWSTFAPTTFDASIKVEKKLCAQLYKQAKKYRFFLLLQVITGFTFCYPDVRIRRIRSIGSRKFLLFSRKKSPL